MRLLARKIEVIILRMLILLLAETIKVVHYNIKSSHLWRKGYYMHTKVQLRYNKKNKTTGLDHPYDIEYDYTSRFPIGFRGCYICGATDHFGNNKCPVGINSKEDKQAFFKKLWSHKPHMKRKNKDRLSIQQGGSINRANSNNDNFNHYAPRSGHSP